MSDSHRLMDPVDVEGKTAEGWLVHFTCRREDREKALEALKLFGEIKPPTTGLVKNVVHGAYRMHTRFEIVQHKYGCSDCESEIQGFVEALEIKDAPDGRCGFVLHEDWSDDGTSFAEFASLEHLLAAVQKVFRVKGREDKLAACPGFLRTVYCGLQTPWFYAVGDQHLAGDIVFPDCVMEDPVYRFGRKFVVNPRNDVQHIVECHGVRLERDLHSSGCYDEKPPRRAVFFDDGYIWHEGSNDPEPRPLRSDQLWIHEAIRQFEQLLAGKLTKFSIEFADGSRFHGRFDPGKNPYGDYWAKLRLKNGEEVKGEFRFDKENAPDHPDVTSYLLSKVISVRREIIGVAEVLAVRRRFRKFDWCGVFAPPEH